MNLFRKLREGAGRGPDAPAPGPDARASGPEIPALDFEGRSFTRRELFAAVGGAEAALRELGVRAGDRVAVCLPKSPETVIHHLAALARGAISLPLNDRFTPSEIAYFLGDSGARVFVTDAAGAGRNGAVLDSLPDVKTVVVAAGEMGAIKPGAVERGTNEPGTVEPVAVEPGAVERGAVEPVAVEPGAVERGAVEPVAVEPAPLPECAAAESDTAMICYTSGTTGRPKGAMLSHGCLVRNMEALREAWRWTARDVLLHALPLFHVHGLVVALHGALNAGSPLVMHRAFDVARVAAALESGRCTLFMGVPTMYHRLVGYWEERGGAPRLDSMRLFVSGSAPLPEGVFRRFRELTGHAILERYGMTEAGMITSNPYDVKGRKAGTAGFPLRGVEVRVAGDPGGEGGSGEASDRSEPGEVLVRSEGLFTGYWNAPEKSLAAFDGEWFRTGDLGRIDDGDGGRLILSGREAELIISGGFNVYSREVEDALAAHPGVAEAAVVGIFDDDLGERVVAVVVPAAGGDRPDENALIAHCRQRLTAYKCPVRVVFREEIPRNSMGKVQKAALRESLQSL